jgi:hypothetical protein
MPQRSARPSSGGVWERAAGVGARLARNRKRVAFDRLPEPLPPPLDWSTPFGEPARTVGIRADLASGYAAAELLDPILNGRLPNETWDIDNRQLARRE